MDNFIPTKASLILKNAEQMHDVVVHESRKKVVNPNKVHVKKKEKISSDLEGSDFEEDLDEQSDQKPMDERKQQELEMKRIRYEVMKFGMSGLEKKKAKKAKIELAISLGAMPPKNIKKNYKKVKEEKRIERSREAKEKKLASGFEPDQLRMNKKKTKKEHKKLVKNTSSKINSKHIQNKSKHQKSKREKGILGVYGKVTKGKDA